MPYFLFLFLFFSIIYFFFTIRPLSAKFFGVFNFYNHRYDVKNFTSYPRDTYALVGDYSTFKFYAADSVHLGSCNLRIFNFFFCPFFYVSPHTIDDTVCLPGVFYLFYFPNTTVDKDLTCFVIISKSKILSSFFFTRTTNFCHFFS